MLQHSVQLVEHRKRKSNFSFRLPFILAMAGLAIVMLNGTAGVAHCRQAATPSRLPAAIESAAAVPAPPAFQPVLPDRGDVPNPLSVNIVGPTSSKADQQFEVQVVVANRGGMPIVRGGMKIFTTPAVKLSESGQAPRPSFNLEPGASITVPIRASASQSGTQGIKVEITADGTWKKSAEHLIEVQKSQLKLELTGHKEIKPNIAADFALTVTNSGDLQTKDTYVFLEAPEGWEFVSSYPAATWVPDKRYAYWSLGDFASGQRFRYQFRLKATRPGVAEVRASAKDAGSAWGESYWFTKADPNAADPPQPLPTGINPGGQISKPPTATSRIQPSHPAANPLPNNVSTNRRVLRR